MQTKKKLKNGIKTYTYEKYSTKNYRIDLLLKRIFDSRGIKPSIKPNMQHINKILGRFIKEKDVFDDLDYMYIDMMSKKYKAT